MPDLTQAAFIRIGEALSKEIDVANVRRRFPRLSIRRRQPPHLEFDLAVGKLAPGSPRQSCSRRPDIRSEFCSLRACVIEREREGLAQKAVALQLANSRASSRDRSAMSRGVFIAVDPDRDAAATLRDRAPRQDRAC